MKRLLFGLSFVVVSMMTFTGMSKTPQPQPGQQPRTELVQQDMRRCPDCKPDKKCRKHFTDHRDKQPRPGQSPRPEQPRHF